jgi:hypothetical protein
MTAGTNVTAPIENSFFYLKVTVCELGEPDEYLLLVSAHPDH